MPKRGENIYKRKDGRWEGRVPIIRDTNGKFRYKSFYGASYMEVKSKMRLGKICTCDEKRKPQNDLFSEQISDWLGSVGLRCKKSTLSKYESICAKYILPTLGKCRTETIGNAQVSELINKTSGLSAGTRNDILRIFKMIAKHAKASGYDIPDFSCATLRQEKKNIRVLSLSEQNTLTDCLLSDTDLYKAGIYLSLCTGMRIGELCALRRGDISFEERVIKIRSTVQRIKVRGKKNKTEVIFSSPKSRSSVRDIPLSDALYDFVNKHYSRLPCNAYILTGRSDRFAEPRLLEYHFKKYARQCGLDDVNFHALRHTFATRCVESGFEIKALSEILGHTSVKITLDRYVHSSVDMKRKNMEMVSGVF